MGPLAETAQAFWGDIVLLSNSPRSQYDALRETIASVGGLPSNVACVALNGQGFHGQHERPWTVAPGNLHLSAAIACDLPVREFGPIMPALPAVAVAEAVSVLGQGRLKPGIKWVNDVLLNRQKVAGSLTALRTENKRIKAVVLGVGLNVAVVPEVVGKSLAPTSLQVCLPPPSPQLEVVLATVLQTLRERFVRLQESGPADLLAAYRRTSVVVGQSVTVWPDLTGEHATEQQQPLTRGRVVGIAPDLSLELEGEAVPVTTGRVVVDSWGT